MVYKFFDKKSIGGTVKSEIISNKELSKELYRQIIQKLKKRKVHSPFTDNIWGADLADVQLICKFNKGRFLLWVIDIYSKYTWVIPLKDKKGIIITNAFENILDKSKHKQNKIWVDKEREFYNRSMKLLLQNNDIEM